MLELFCNEDWIKSVDCRAGRAPKRPAAVITVKGAKAL